MLGGYVHKGLPVALYHFLSKKKQKKKKRTICLVELLTTAFLLSLHIEPYIEAEGTC